MKNFLVIIIAVIVSLLAVYAFGPRGQGTGTAAAKEDVYARVMRTKTIRCGYIVWKPYHYFNDLNDPSTRTGISVDIMNEIGRILDLRIEWGEEMGWGDIGIGFETGRYDMACTVMWPDAPKYKNFALTRSFLFSAIYPWVRADDTRFDNHPEKINVPDVKFGVVDGGFVQSLAKETYPQASMVSLPPSTQGGEFYLSLVQKKFDITFQDINEAKAYLDEHPGAIRQVLGIPPIKIMPLVMAVPRESQSLKNAVDGALSEMIDNGFFEKIQEKYKTHYFMPQRSFSMMGMPE